MLAGELLRAELREVVADPLFVRAPILARALEYLVEVSAKGNGDSLKSYTVAVEGLGRSVDFDPQTDTYARVLVVRLRRALDDYYLRAGANRPERLYIPPGSYAVKLVDNQQPRAVPGMAGAAGQEQERVPVLRKPILLGLAILAIVASVVLTAWLVSKDSGDAARWQTREFPLVLVRIAPSSKPQDADLHKAIEERFVSSITKYESVRVASKLDRGVDYVVELTPQYLKSGQVLSVALTDIRRNRRSPSVAFAISPASENGSSEAMDIERQAFRLFGYSGLIAVTERRNSVTTDTPYDCWLRYSGRMLVDGGLGDSKLTSCAKKWYEHSPQHPIAAALYAWTLTSATIREPFENRRRGKLNQAIGILEASRAVNPGSKHVLVALARAYAFGGDWRSLRRVMDDVNLAGGATPDVRVMVGTLMAFQNDPTAEAEIDAAIAFHPDTAPSQYYIGKFIAAMMRDDVNAAGIAANKLAAGGQASIWNHVLPAAYYSRVGKREQAKLHWSKATEIHPILAIQPKVFLANLPVADPVEQRLTKWLELVIED